MQRASHVGEIYGLTLGWGVALGLLQYAHDALYARYAGVGEGAEVIIVADAHRRLHNQCSDGVAWTFVSVDTCQTCRYGGYAACVGSIDQTYALLFDKIHQRLLERVTRGVAGGQWCDGDIANAHLLSHIYGDNLRHRQLQLLGSTLKITLGNVVPCLTKIYSLYAGA